LYAISNALATHSIYIHKVKIASVGDRVMDQFFIADRWGRKIENAAEQERLRTAVAMLKQFTRFLPEAPDPAKAIRHFDQFLDKASEARFPAHVLSFLSRPEGMERLARMLGSSDFLWDDFLGIHFEDLLPLLEDFSGKLPPLRKSLATAESFEDRKAAVNQLRDARLFMIDAAHLLDPTDSLTDFSQAVTDLAELVLNEAARICRDHLGGAHGAYTICALGKFGGREMGYASDLELMFVHETGGDTSFFERMARCIIDVVETRRNAIFHVDLRLRPYGDAGSWSIPFDEFARYYSAEGQAAPFERQALIKLRWVAGDEALGRRVEAHRDRYTYSGLPWNAEDALHLRRRQMRELAKSGEINVKYSAGGIVDVEYAIQYLQLVHGAAKPELRLTNTLDALDQLHRSGIIERDRFEVLRDGYSFLRKLIDALRIVRGDASDLVLPEESSDEFKTLARRLGYRERNWKKGAALLAQDIRQWMGRVHEQFPLG
jgi:glutamate-ammonia-ligase adenylyltransferase